MKSSFNCKQSASCLLIASIGLIRQTTTTVAAEAQSQLHSKLLDRCCQVGKERAFDSLAKFNCKSSAREALITTTTTTGAGGRAGGPGSLLALTAESLLSREPSFGDQCELVLESCCLARHRTKNCDSGKHFAKSGAACMDVELSKEASLATESFNDCCMSCSLGILAARTNNQSESQAGQTPTRSSLAGRCKLISPLASSLSGQLYEQTYIECCQENLPVPLGALTEPGAPIDCSQANPCAQRCISGSRLGDRCDCFSGYKLASDGVNCLDVDECRLNLHTCNRQSEVCDNTRGGFKCLAREVNNERSSLELPNDDMNLSADSFMPSRLCPLGSRWNVQEAQCQPIAAAQANENHHHSHQQQAARSASLSSYHRIRHSSSHI